MAKLVNSLAARLHGREGHGRDALVGAVLFLLVACGSTPGPAARPPEARRPPTPIAAWEVVANAATRFMTLLQEGSYESQWTLLSPTAQGQWPSSSARQQALAARFTGMMVRYTLGVPVRRQTWVSAETLTQVPQLWEVPVSVTLTGGPAQLPGTIANFDSVPLYLSLSGGQALVVGEGAASVDAPVLLPATRPDRTLSVPVLMYHDVGPAPNPANFNTTDGYNLQYQLTVQVPEFAEQMSWLHQQSYHAISLARLADALYDGLPLPPKPIVISLDDGFLGQYANALQILESHGFTATLFICSGLVGWQSKSQQYMNWQQIEQAAADGFWIEDHTINDDTTTYGQSNAVLERLLLSSQQVIEQRVGQPVQFFAYSSVWPYPSANDSGALVDNIVPVLKQGGYQLAVTDPKDSSTQVLASQPYQVPRIRVSPDESLSQFASYLGG